MAIAPSESTNSRCIKYVEDFRSQNSPTDSSEEAKFLMLENRKKGRMNSPAARLD